MNKKLQTTDSTLGKGTRSMWKGDLVFTLCTFVPSEFEWLQSFLGREEISVNTFKKLFNKGI